jgi:hypothetical protein
MRDVARTRLLTRHFLRRFLDNDFISPHVDLHENVAMILAAIVSSSIFIAFVFSMKYLAGYPAPAITAVYSLGDKAFFLAAPMIVMALVATMQWDALALDARDAANLSPLPISSGTLVVAKVAALLLFASLFAAALTVLPAALYSVLFVSRLPVTMVNVLQLVATHLVVVLAACLFGFATVVAIREILRAVLGELWFRRVSPLVQAALVLFLLSMFLLLPGLPDKVVESWPKTEFRDARLLPPLWFLGLWETLSGGVVATIDFAMPERVLERNIRHKAVYDAQASAFAELARMAMIGLLTVVPAAIAAYMWNARGLPQPPPASQRYRYLIAALTRVFGGRSQTRAAGFSLALQTIVRSAPHRLAIAAAGAAALAISIVMLRNLTANGIIVHQTAVITVLIAGFRHAVRLPVELRANWVFQVAWRRADAARYTSGVKRAAIVGLAAPAIGILFPLAVWVLGLRVASAHAAVGFVYALALVEIVFVRYQKMPFVSQYVPGGNFKKLAPLFVIGFFIFVYGFARIERNALASQGGLATLLATLGAVYVAARVFDEWKRRERPPTFDEQPEGAPQWLGLSS